LTALVLGAHAGYPAPPASESAERLWHRIGRVAETPIGAAPALSAVPGLDARALERSLAPLRQRIRDGATFLLDSRRLDRMLNRVRDEKQGGRLSKVVIMLPLPDGTLAAFRVEESPMMDERLARRAGISSFAAQAVDLPGVTARFDWSPAGLHAMVLHSQGTVYVDAIEDSGGDAYVSYWAEDAIEVPCDKCQASDLVEKVPILPVLPLAQADTKQERVFKLFVAVTDEYKTAVKSPKTVDIQVHETVSDINLIYEKEIGIKFDIVQIRIAPAYHFKFDPVADPDWLDLLQDVQDFLDQAPAVDYDIGILFHAGAVGGGTIPSRLCRSAKGASFVGNSPITGPQFVRTAAHEMGHMLGAAHVFSSPDCDEDPWPFEPGLGTTIMSYGHKQNTVCGLNDRLQEDRDDYFNASSRDQMLALIDSRNGLFQHCGEEQGATNNIPTVTATSPITIPPRTPFVLSAQGDDADPADVPNLKYTWEQGWRNGTGASPAALNKDDDGTIILFRSFPPTTESSRMFPRREALFAGNVPGPEPHPARNTGEQLPQQPETLYFRVTVRDGRAVNGATSYQDVRVNVVGDAFKIVKPDDQDALECGGPGTVRWSGGPSGTDLDISVTTDQGVTFFPVEQTGPSIDGGIEVIYPHMSVVASTRAVVKIQPVGQPYFALSPYLKVEDESAPSITCPADVTVSATQPDGASSGDAEVKQWIASAVATDSCDPAPKITTDIHASIPAGQASAVTFTATDKSGNQATCVSHITVQGSCGGGGGLHGPSCDENPCKVGQGLSAHVLESLIATRPARARAAHGTDRVPRATEAVTAVVVNRVLTVMGTSGPDEIVLRLQGNNDIVIQDAIANPANTFTFTRADFDRMIIDGGAGDDLLALDDVNGPVSDVAPIDFEGGDGNDAVVGRTGSLSVQEVLDMESTLATAQGLLTTADTLIHTAGLMSPLGAGTDDMVSRAVGLAKTSESSLIEPAAMLAQQAHDALLLPAAARLRMPFEVPAPPQKPGAIRRLQNVMEDAYGNVVGDVMCRLAGVCQDHTPGAFGGAAPFRIKTQGDDVARAAQSIRDAALAKVAQCQADLNEAGKDRLTGRLENLRALIQTQADLCPEGFGALFDPFIGGRTVAIPSYCAAQVSTGTGVASAGPPIGLDGVTGIAPDSQGVPVGEEDFTPDDPDGPGPDPGLDGGGISVPFPGPRGVPLGAVARLHRRRPVPWSGSDERNPRLGCLDVIEKLVDCMENEIAVYEALSDTCSGALDRLASTDVEGDAGFIKMAENGLLATGDTIATQVDEGSDNILTRADDFAGDSDDYAADVDRYAADTESILTSAMLAYQALGQSTVESPAGVLETQTEAAFDNAATAMLDTADVLSQAAQDLIDATIGRLEQGTSLRTPFITECDEIEPSMTIRGGPGFNFIVGTLDDDHIIGGDGADIIAGLAGNDLIEGGDGVDIVLGGSGVNDIRGGEGIDILIGGLQKDCLQGEGSIDLLIGRMGDDELSGGADTDILIGGDGDDIVHGDAGLDLVLGGPGENKLYGDLCIDVVVGGNDDDEMHGGPGQVLTAQNVSLDLGDLLLGRDGCDEVHADEPDDSGTGIDVVFGGPGDRTDGGLCDHLFGGDGGDLTVGNDFTLKLGNLIFGGPGRDEIRSGEGIDVLFGGTEGDDIGAGEGFLLSLHHGDFTIDLGDLVFGGPGNDTIAGDGAGETGIDVLFGGPNDDTIDAGDGGDLHVGGSSGDFDLTLGNLVFGGDGADTITAGLGIDVLFGGIGDDTLSGGDGATIDVDNGTFTLELGDLLFGAEGSDHLYGDASVDSGPDRDGIDFLFGGPNDDFLFGGNGGRLVIEDAVDILFGNLLIGSTGNDVLIAGYDGSGAGAEQGIDFMFGGDQNDQLHGEDGGELSIGASPPVFEVNLGNLMLGQDGDDTLTARDGMDVMFGGPGVDTMTGGLGIDLMFGGPGADHMDGGDGGHVTVVIDGVPTPIPFGNLMFGGDDSDTITSGGREELLEIDLLFGNQCADTIHAGGGLLDLVFGGPGGDSLYGEDGSDFIFGGDGKDTIHGGPGVIDLLFGNQENDEVDGDGGVADFIFGHKDDDLVQTGEGVLEVAFGGPGRDVVRGGSGLSGVDVLFGGADPDEVDGGGGVLDVAFGNGDDDEVQGGAVVNLVFGNSEQDVVTAGCTGPITDCQSGINLAFGNDGEDFVMLGDGLGAAFGGQNDDAMSGTGLVMLELGGAGSDTMSGASDTLSLNLLFGNSGPDDIRGGGGINLLFGGSEADNIAGSSGLDLILGGDDGDHLAGGGGPDLVFGNRGEDLIDGGDGTDLLFGNRGNDCLFGGPGAPDFVFGNSDDDHVAGGNVDASGTSADGRDYVFGNRNCDTLYACDDDRRFKGIDSGCGEQKVDGCEGCGPQDLRAGSVCGTKRVTRGGAPAVPLPGVTMFLDMDGQNDLDPDEPRTVTRLSGAFSFKHLADHDYVVREVVTSQEFVPQYDLPSTVIRIDSSTTSYPGQDLVNLDSCGPNVAGTGCAPCPCTGTLTPVFGTLCAGTFDACTTNSDCECGVACVQKVVDCVCQISDSDGDGIQTTNDNCPFDPNQNQLDSDGDGVGNVCDNCPSVSNPNQADVDHDRVGDLCEVSDVDFDGVPSNLDNCPNSYNPRQTDYDGDGVGDVCDNCWSIVNANQADLDHNGVGDVCASSDMDLDGIANAQDNCPAVSNPSQADSDADGVGDVCDNCPTIANPLQEDTETARGPDGICGTADDRASLYGRDGVCGTADDVTGDGVGEACEVPGDSDQDGVPNATDNCPNHFNPTQADSDGDGIGDICDNCPAVGNPNQADSDHDGIGDACDP
jgi:Ca2+-binding RTX toxin-like protein